MSFFDGEEERETANEQRRWTEHDQTKAHVAFLEKEGKAALSNLVEVASRSTDPVVREFAAKYLTLKQCALSMKPKRDARLEHSVEVDSGSR